METTAPISENQIVVLLPRKVEITREKHQRRKRQMRRRGIQFLIVEAAWVDPASTAGACCIQQDKKKINSPL